MSDTISLVITAVVAFIMFQTGMTVEVAAAKRLFKREHLRVFSGLAAANYIVIPAVTLTALYLLSIDSSVGAALVILALFPCAPTVPTLASHTVQDSEWATMVFVGFTVVSVFTVIVAASLLLHPTASRFANVSTLDISRLWPALGRYFTVIYVPMLIGLLIRTFASSLVLRYWRTLQRVAGVALFGILILILLSGHGRLLSIVAESAAPLFLFELLCLAVAAVLGETFGGPLQIRLFSSALRNFAMALAFANALLPGSDIALNILAFSAFTTALAFVMRIGLHRFNLSESPGR